MTLWLASFIGGMSSMSEAFQLWCADCNIDFAISHAMFGRLARWQEGRIGGAVWYLDCELAEGYGARESASASRPHCPKATH
jgi:hypothetical protein